MKILTTCLVSSLILAAACNGPDTKNDEDMSMEPMPASQPTSQPTSQPSDAGAMAGADLLDESGYDHFGAGVAEAGSEPLAVSTVLATPEEYTGRTIRLAGDISAVCRKKGCWMHLGQAPEHVVVRFKDYGFFVPTDASGPAIAEGRLTIDTVTVDELRHLAEDAGKSPAEIAKITEPQKQVRFLATGVAIER